jgi:hypothetical protein
MTKIRTPFTPHYAVKRCFDLVPLADIAAAAERSEKLVYKWSDPDEGVDVSVAAALRIDALVKKRSGIAPFYDLFARHAEMPAMMGPINIRETVLMASAALGGFSSAVMDAVSPQSEEGTAICARERQLLMIEIENMRQQLARAEAAVIAASKGG